MGSSLHLRVDNRLLHGQVVQYWIGHLAVRHLIVADTGLSMNDAMLAIYRMALPGDVSLTIVPVHRLPAAIVETGGASTLVLMKDVYHVAQGIMCGLEVRRVTLGNVHAAPGRVRVTDSVYLSDEEQSALARLVKRGVEVEIQTFPRESLRLEVDANGGSRWSKR